MVARLTVVATVEEENSLLFLTWLLPSVMGMKSARFLFLAAVEKPMPRKRTDDMVIAMRMMVSMCDR